MFDLTYKLFAYDKKGIMHTYTTTCVTAMLKKKKAWKSHEWNVRTLVYNDGVCIKSV